MRALAVVAAVVLLCARLAHADTIDSNVRQLTGTGYKVRLAAALALSKSRDARAVIALADALDRDEDAAIRRVCALAISKMIDARTPDDAVALSFDALDKAAQTDGDANVRMTASATLRELAPFRPHKTKVPEPRGNTPEVFVNVDATTDQSRMLPTDAGDRLVKVVKRSVERTGFSTTWPTGALPTSAELTQGHSRAFIVASTVKKIEITKAGRMTEVACTLSIRIAPWTGKDGGEKWEASKAGTAQGSAKATTGNTDREVNGGVRDCLESVAEELTARQVTPFLRRLAGS
ncbi:MAG TPA: HEAT repeat domain-containing protein [Kofleriaceae bacterium]|jgi:hypothetical protein